MGGGILNYLNPITGLRQAIPGQNTMPFAGPNSWLSKMSAQLPAINWGPNKYLTPPFSPLNQENAQAYENRRSPPAGYVAPATPYAGAPPSLALAQAGYQTPSSSPTATPANTNGPAPVPADAPLTPRVQATPRGSAVPTSSSGVSFYPNPFDTAYARAAAASQRAQGAANPWSSALGGAA